MREMFVISKLKTPWTRGQPITNSLPTQDAAQHRKIADIQQYLERDSNHDTSVQEVQDINALDRATTGTGSMSTRSVRITST
jgi:hypothetical protein